MQFQARPYLHFTSKTVGDVTTNFINDGAYVVGEVSGDSIIKYTYGNGLVSINNNGTLGYYHTDEHGNVSTISDASKKIVADYDFDAFGNETVSTDTYYNPMRYCGEYYDTETGLIYLRARYYDPSIGRFISEDPIKDGTNWYVYCSNNPVAFMDPNGCKKSPRMLYGTKATGNKDCINGQSVDTNIKDLEYGVKKISYNGCELIAVYNSLVLVNKKPENFQNIIDVAEKTDGVMWLDGRLGTTPKGVGILLDKYSQPYTKTYFPTEFNALLEDGGVYILVAWNPGDITIHTVALTCDNENNIVVYNVAGNIVHPYKYSATESSTGLDEYINNETGGAIVFYKLEVSNSDESNDST